jgi:hypothetical protein
MSFCIFFAEEGLFFMKGGIKWLTGFLLFFPFLLFYRLLGKPAFILFLNSIGSGTSD